jgi:hypothetical protein
VTDIEEVAGGYQGNASGQSSPPPFAEDGCATANLYQRFKRARDDLSALLRLLVSPEDLS